MIDIYRIKGILFSILSLSGPLSGEPERVSQIMADDGPDNDGIKKKALYFVYQYFTFKNHYNVGKKIFFADTEKISSLNSIYFHAKTILSGDYVLAYFGL